MKVLLPVMAAATRGGGVTYGHRRVRSAGGQPGGGGGAPAGGGGQAGVFTLAQVPLTLANKCPLVALHPLQLLLSRHAAPRLQTFI